MSYVPDYSFILETLLNAFSPMKDTLIELLLDLVAFYLTIFGIKLVIAWGTGIISELFVGHSFDFHVTTYEDMDIDYDVVDDLDLDYWFYD